MIARAEIDRLTPQEKLLLVAEVWDSLSANEANVPVTPQEKAQMDQRWAAFLADPSRALTQAEFDRRVDEQQ